MRKLVGILLIWLFGTAAAMAADSGNLNSLYQPAGNAISGNPDGHVTVVEFFDYNCGYCRLMYPSVRKIVSQNGDLRLIFREYPVLGPHSTLPAEAALAAQKQGKYQVMHNAMMEALEPLNQDEIMRLAKENGLDTARLAQDMQSPSVTNQIQNNLSMGQSMNIQGVPTFIVVRTSPPSTQKPEVVVGPSVSELKTMINQAQNGA